VKPGAAYAAALSAKSSGTRQLTHKKPDDLLTHRKKENIFEGKKIFLIAEVP